MITPVLILIPMIICEHLALKSLRFADPGRTFVLVYFVNGVSLMLYCIMQAGVKSTWMYIALSLFRGFLQVFQTATVKLRNKMFIRFWEYLENTSHCIRLGQLPQDTDHHRRLRVDKEIQAMLYQNTALVLSQAYLALYLITNFHKQLWAILKEPVKRIFIGLGISFFANCLSILIHIHWYKTPLQKVWLKNWKLHMLAVSLGCAMTIWYFTAVLLTVFEDSAKGLNIKNCTAPL